MSLLAPTRVGLVGAGYIASTHLEALSALGGVTVSAIIDPNLAAAERMVGRVRGAVFGGWGAILGGCGGFLGGCLEKVASCGVFEGFFGSYAGVCVAYVRSCVVFDPLLDDRSAHLAHRMARMRDRMLLMEGEMLRLAEGGLLLDYRI